MQRISMMISGIYLQLIDF